MIGLSYNLLMKFLVLLLLITFSAKAESSDYVCYFEKKSEVMKDFSAEEQTTESNNSNKELIQIIGAPVSVMVGKSALIYRVKVYNIENSLTFRIIEANDQSIIGWNEEQKFSTFFSLEKQTMVFTELLSGDHVAAYFYSCMRVLN